MKQKIVGFHLDEENHWVAELECGHNQHVRHDPPFFARPWVQTNEGRESQKGKELDCVRCDELALRVAKTVQQACLEKACHAYEDAGLSGICAEGRFDLACDAIRSLDLSKIIT